MILEIDVVECVRAIVGNIFLQRGVCEGEDAADVEFGEGDAGVVEFEIEPEAGLGDVEGEG